jgi:hypothetical protein
MMMAAAAAALALRRHWGGPGFQVDDGAVLGM